MQQTTVFTIPATLKNNPYLELLYTHVNGAEYVVRPFSVREIVGMLFMRQRPIVHIHWETTIYGSRYWLYSCIKLGTRFPLLFLARACGARIVWTMHNLHAHEYPFHRLDTFGRMLMRQLASVVIIQIKTVADEFSKKYPKTRFVYIPHGNYIDVYGKALQGSARQEVCKRLRAEWQLPEEGTVLLALGAIRPYKQFEVLIEHTGTAAALIIAGKGEAAYIEELESFAETHAAGTVRIMSGFVPDEKIKEFFAVADYAVFAHGDSSLSSGALMLALSYGTPVITFPMPADEILHEGVNGFVVKDGEAFSALLTRISHESVPDPAAVMETVQVFSWEQVAQQLREVYASI